MSEEFKREDKWGFTDECAGRDKALIRFATLQIADSYVTSHIKEHVEGVYKAWLESNE